MIMYVEKWPRRKFKEKCDFGRAGEHDDNIQWTDDLNNVLNNWSKLEYNSEVITHSNATGQISILEELETTNYAHWVHHLQLFSYLSALCSVCTTVARITSRRFTQFVDKVGSTVFHLDLFRILASVSTSGEADLPVYITIYHCWFCTIQPAWEVCSTSVFWHRHCWHFCPRSPLKTIPSLNQQVVTQTCGGRWAITLSVRVIQSWVVITTVGWRINCNSKRKW